MVELRRSVRVNINPGDEAAGSNGHAGRPAMVGFGRHYLLEAACRGEPDPNTGYLIGIQEIDRAVRERGVPILQRACREDPGVMPWSLLPELAAAIAGGIPVPLVEIRLGLTPTLLLEYRMATAQDQRAIVRQRFEFAAAHRLHTDTLSDEENRRIFGKCNNASGHGHNYEVEVAISVPTGAGLSVAAFESIVDAEVIEPFDHTHLNEDTEAFAPGTGVIPSVENIARVFYKRLEGPIAGGLPDARLHRVTVWETPRTSATYPGDE